MVDTKDNVKDAFAGESQANQKYRAFSKKAEKDGFPNIAKLFKTTAEAERIHAEAYLASMDGINSTVDNLIAAIAGETYEYKEMYPPMLEAAEAENHKVKRMFKYALLAEEVHAKLYQYALECASQGKDIDFSEIYLCPTCGNIEFGKPKDKCKICGLPADKFVTVN